MPKQSKLTLSKPVQQWLLHPAVKDLYVLISVKKSYPADYHAEMQAMANTLKAMVAERARLWQSAQFIQEMGREACLEALRAPINITIIIADTLQAYNEDEPERTRAAWTARGALWREQYYPYFQAIMDCVNQAHTPVRVEPKTWQEMMACPMVTTYYRRYREAFDRHYGEDKAFREAVHDKGNRFLHRRKTEDEQTAAIESAGGQKAWERRCKTEPLGANPLEYILEELAALMGCLSRENSPVPTLLLYPSAQESAFALAHEFVKTRFLNGSDNGVHWIEAKISEVAQRSSSKKRDKQIGFIGYDEEIALPREIEMDNFKTLKAVLFHKTPETSLFDADIYRSERHSEFLRACPWYHDAMPNYSEETFTYPEQSAPFHAISNAFQESSDIVLVGISGAGKSTLAQAYCHSHPYKQRYPYVFWLGKQPHLSGAWQTTVIRQLVKTLGLCPESVLQETPNIAETLKESLACFPERLNLPLDRILIVLDDITPEDYLSFRALIPPAIRLLVSSNNQIWPHEIRQLPILPLQPAESIALLEKFTIKERDELYRLAAGLDHLPIALVIAGSYLRQNAEETVTAYLQKLQETDERLFKNKRALPDNTKKSLHLLFHVSIERVKAALQDIGLANPEIDKTHLLDALLLALTYYEITDLPLLILLNTAQFIYDHLTDSDGDTHFLALNAENTRICLNLLAQYCLIEYRYDTDNLCFHRTIQRVMTYFREVDVGPSISKNKALVEKIVLAVLMASFGLPLSLQREETIQHVTFELDDMRGLDPNALSLDALQKFFTTLSTKYTADKLDQLACQDFTMQNTHHLSRFQTYAESHEIAHHFHYKALLFLLARSAVVMQSLDAGKAYFQKVLSVRLDRAQEAIRLTDDYITNQSSQMLALFSALSGDMATAKQYMPTEAFDVRIFESCLPNNEWGRATRINLQITQAIQTKNFSMAKISTRDFLRQLETQDRPLMKAFLQVQYALLLGQSSEYQEALNALHPFLSQATRNGPSFTLWHTFAYMAEALFYYALDDIPSAKSAISACIRFAAQLPTIFLKENAELIQKLIQEQCPVNVCEFCSLLVSAISLDVQTLIHKIPTAGAGNDPEQAPENLLNNKELSMFLRNEEQAALLAPLERVLQHNSTHFTQPTTDHHQVILDALETTLNKLTSREASLIGSLENITAIFMKAISILCTNKAVNNDSLKTVFHLYLTVIRQHETELANTLFQLLVRTQKEISIRRFLPIALSEYANCIDLIDSLEAHDATRAVFAAHLNNFKPENRTLCHYYAAFLKRGLSGRSDALTSQLAKINFHSSYLFVFKQILFQTFLSENMPIDASIIFIKALVASNKINAFSDARIVIAPAATRFKTILDYIGPFYEGRFIADTLLTQYRIGLHEFLSLLFFEFSKPDLSYDCDINLFYQVVLYLSRNTSYSEQCEHCLPYREQGQAESPLYQSLVASLVKLRDKYSDVAELYEQLSQIVRIHAEHATGRSLPEAIHQLAELINDFTKVPQEQLDLLLEHRTALGEYRSGLMAIHKVISSVTQGTDIARWQTTGFHERIFFLYWAVKYPYSNFVNLLLCSNPNQREQLEQIFRLNSSRTSLDARIKLLTGYNLLADMGYKVLQHNQVIAILQALDAQCDYYQRVGTGQGKSLIIGMLAPLLIEKHGKGIIVITTTDGLAARDHGKFQPYFKQLGFSSLLLGRQRLQDLPERVDIIYTDAKALTSAIREQVIRAGNAEFKNQHLFDLLAKRVVVMDEFDAILLKWRAYSICVHELQTKSTPEGQLARLTDEEFTAQLGEHNPVLKPLLNSLPALGFNELATTWLSKTKMQRIKPPRQQAAGENNEPVSFAGSRSHDLCHGIMQILPVYFNMLAYLHFSERVYGFSGSATQKIVDCLSEQLRPGSHFLYLPNFCPPHESGNTCRFSNLDVPSDSAQNRPVNPGDLDFNRWRELIKGDLEQAKQLNQPVLVFVDVNNPNEVAEVQAIVKEVYGHRDDLPVASQSHEMTGAFVNQAIQPQQVTLGSMLMGRGIDFSIPPDIKDQIPDGLHVLITAAPTRTAYDSNAGGHREYLDEAELIQVVGRTARMGQNGTHSIISRKCPPIDINPPDIKLEKYELFHYDLVRRIYNILCTDPKTHPKVWQRFILFNGLLNATETNLKIGIDALEKPLLEEDIEKQVELFLMLLRSDEPLTRAHLSCFDPPPPEPERRGFRFPFWRRNTRQQEQAPNHARHDARDQRRESRHAGIFSDCFARPS